MIHLFSRLPGEVAEHCACVERDQALKKPLAINSKRQDFFFVIDLIMIIIFQWWDLSQLW